jgi:hypothetical protein
VNKVFRVAPSAEGWDPRGWLSSPDEGKRLVAYALLYARPRADLLEEIINSVTQIENTRFGQYWALRAIGKNLAGRTSREVSPSAVQHLRDWKRWSLTPGGDRYYEVSRILKQLNDTQSS